MRPARRADRRCAASAAAPPRPSRTAASWATAATRSPAPAQRHQSRTRQRCAAAYPRCRGPARPPASKCGGPCPACPRAARAFQTRQTRPDWIWCRLIFRPHGARSRRGRIGPARAFWPAPPPWRTSHAACSFWPAPGRASAPRQRKARRRHAAFLSRAPRRRI